MSKGLGARIVPFVARPKKKKRKKIKGLNQGIRDQPRASYEKLYALLRPPFVKPDNLFDPI
jgi:hypothetical protein